MGIPKPTARLRGRPLIEYPLNAAVGAKLETFVVAKQSSDLPPLDAPVVIEPEEPTHVLAGIVAALEAANGRPVLAVAADMPFMEGTLLAWLASHPGTTVVEAAGRLQPLLARFEPDTVTALREARDRSEPAQETIAALNPHVVGDAELVRFGKPMRMCFNVNTPEQLREAESDLRERELRVLSR